MISIYWHPVKVRDVGSGESFEAPPFGSDQPLHLLHKIQAMKKATPITLSAAAWLYATELYFVFNTQGGRATGKWSRENHFVDWIASQGLQIQLSGNEFEMEEVGL